MWYDQPETLQYIAIDFLSNFLYLLRVPNANGIGSNGWQGCFRLSVKLSSLPNSFYIAFDVPRLKGSSSQQYKGILMIGNKSLPAPLPVPERKMYLLIDRFHSEVIGRIEATPETVECLNKPDWMKSKGWIYEEELQSAFSFDQK